jgi:hypothetical protein
LELAQPMVCWMKTCALDSALCRDEIGGARGLPQRCVGAVTCAISAPSPTNVITHAEVHGRPCSRECPNGRCHLQNYHPLPFCASGGNAVRAQLVGGA